MADIGWRRGSSPAARTSARQRAGLTPASASNTLSCQRETLHSQQLRSIKKSIDSDHGIYRVFFCCTALSRDWHEADLPRRFANRPLSERSGSVKSHPKEKPKWHIRCTTRL